MGDIGDRYSQKSLYHPTLNNLKHLLSATVSHTSVGWPNADIIAKLRCSSGFRISDVIIYPLQYFLYFIRSIELALDE